MSSLSPAALQVINDYLHLPFKQGPVQCPYYNNERLKIRGGLRVAVGKGSPADIVEEALILSLRDRVNLDTLTTDEVKKFLVDHKIGIDCSGLVYYILDAELKARGKNKLSFYLKFPFIKNPLRKLLTKFRPVENMGVSTLAHDLNSQRVRLNDVQPGDFIVMLNPNSQPDPAPEQARYGAGIAHVILIHQIDLQDNKPHQLHYTHTIPWRTDGKYGHGVRQGTITINNIAGSLLDQTWAENGVNGEQNDTYSVRAKGAKELALRRLKALS